MPTSKQSNVSMQAELTMLRSAIDATRSAVIITDARHTDNPIIYVNESFLELTGYSRKEVMGRNCRFLQGEDTEVADIQQIREAVKQRQNIHLTLKNYKKDGTPFWNDLIVSPVFDGKELTHFIGLQLDISDRVNYEQELIRSRKALKASNLELEQFTYAASHDLQEPLRMVSSFMQLIEQDYKSKLDDKGREYIAFAVNGAERMQSLIRDLLALSRVRTKREKPERVRLRPIIESAMFNLQASITDSGATVGIEGEDKLMYVEEVHMLQVFQNLIGNALKYRKPDKKPEVHIKLSTEGDWFYIAISDNGIGMDTKYRERIFGVFQRLHTKSEYPGNGIGLSLCHKIIEQHGGTIKVISNIGEGSTFTVALPRSLE